MIHGIFFREDNEVNFQVYLDKTLNKLLLHPQNAKLKHFQNKHAWLSEEISTRASEFEVEMIDDDSQDSVIVAWARLDNREDLASSMGISHEECATLSCAQLILEAYTFYGENCVDHLFGDYSFTIYDNNKNQLFCVRDRLGTRPFYYYLSDTLFAFSASQTLFHYIDEIDISPRLEWASQYLMGLSMDFEKTAYHNILKLPPGHCLTVSEDHYTLKKYHEFHTQKLPLASSDDYLLTYKKALEDAIKCRSDVNHPLGCESSGGLDSSTTTAYAFNYFKGDIKDFHTFAFTFLEDEPAKSLLINQKLHIPVGHVCCEIYPENPQRLLQVMGAPPEHSISTFHEVIYDIAEKHGVKTLLSGFGGDEFVTSIHGNLYFHELIKEKKWGTLYTTLEGNLVTRTLRFIKLLFETKGKAGSRRRGMANAYKMRRPLYLLSDTLSKQFSIEKDYSAVASFEYGYDNLDQFTLERRWVPFVTTRLENCSLMAASYGVEYRWPLLDSRLIQLFLSIPSKEKIHKGVGRYLHRRAVKGVVPDAIVNQLRKYMGEFVSKKTKSITLNTDLHPNLTILLNQKKLKEQLEWMKNYDADSVTYSREKAIIINRNFETINHLDNWLKYFFKEAFTWKD